MGGNDSFLISQQQKAINFTSFYTQLLTLIHESLHTVVRQARHLQLPILGIPLDCGCGETFLAHIEKGLDAMRQRVTGIELSLVICILITFESGEMKSSLSIHWNICFGKHHMTSS
jgi:hypothetical protein